MEIKKLKKKKTVKTYSKPWILGIILLPLEIMSEIQRKEAVIILSAFFFGFSVLPIVKYQMEKSS